MSTLRPDQWQIVSPYLDQALTLPEEERGRWLDEMRRENPDLARQLEELLEEHRAAEGKRYLGTGPALLAASRGLAGQTVGAYKLISMVGQGGMGAVWLAERSDGRFERKAAVKFLSAALVGHDGEERFKREGAILGRFSHPNIAELLDAGVSSSGQPYIVLEYVQGEPIDAYCDRRHLSVAARVRLFLDVLGAVAHAHAHLIVHRDIKPTNVLVSKDGQVKLLDFGIAKLLEGEGAEGAATMLTREGGSSLTPAYAAPEQITGGLVTTATDIYALGVLLYLLLGGQHSAAAGPLSAAQMVRAIVETEPPRLSSVVAARQETDAHRANAAKRDSTPEKLQRQLRGDLDIIVGKTLKKNPQERYSTVTALADDLHRYLKNEPIRARPDTLRYRTIKFVRRNRIAVMFTTLAILAVAAAVIGTVLQARTTRIQRDLAVRERDRSTRITDFMTNMFKVSDPSEARGNSVTAREILDKASKDINIGLAKDPDTQAHMLFVMGTVYDNLGLIERAKSMVERALQVQRQVLGPENPETLRSAGLLGVLLLVQGHEKEAEKVQSDTLVIQRRVLGIENLDTLTTMGRLGAVLTWEGRPAEGEKLQREALAIERRVLGPENPKTLVLAGSLANTLWEEGEKSYPEAEALERQTLGSELRVFGPDHPDTAAAMSTLGLVLRLEGKFAESEKVCRDALSIEVRILGPDHPDTLDVRNILAIDLAKQSRYKEAEALYRETLAIQKRVLGADDPYTADTIYNLGCLAAVQGRTQQALSWLSEAVDHGLRSGVVLNMEQDEDLKSLLGDPRFTALIAHAKARAAPAQQKQ